MINVPPGLLKDVKSGEPGGYGISGRFATGYAPSDGDERDAPWDGRYSPPRNQGNALDTRPQAIPGIRGMDLRDLCSPVRDQGYLEACTAFAVTSMAELLQIRARGSFVQLSPRFLWYTGRQYEKLADRDDGISPRSALRVMLHVGCCPEAYDPYPAVAYFPLLATRAKKHKPQTPAEWREYLTTNAPSTLLEEVPGVREAVAMSPTAEAVAQAANFRISAFNRIWLDYKAVQLLQKLNQAKTQDDQNRELDAYHEYLRAQETRSDANRHKLDLALEAIKACLQRWYPVVLVGNVYTNFVDSPDNHVSTGGVLSMPSDEELNYPVAEHCVLVVGYLDQADHGGYLICKNSLGTVWGQRGYFYLPYEYVRTPGCMLEAWTAT